MSRLRTSPPSRRPLAVALSRVCGIAMPRVLVAWRVVATAWADEHLCATGRYPVKVMP